MGYCIKMIDSNLTIKKENFDRALESLKKVFIPENMRCIDYNDGKEYPHFSWVDTNTVLNSKSLEEALIEIRYTPIYNLDGDICNVEFTGEKYGDDYIFFSALAPYVESDSYLCFMGEDGATLKCVFKNGEVK